MFRDPRLSPLPAKDRRTFDSLAFFPVDTAYRVMAQFRRTPKQTPFEMPTTQGTTQLYEKYGELYLEINGQVDTLMVYQSHRLRALPQYRNYLFLPFKDATNGTTSYKGGRYINLTIPPGDSLIVDFNQAYNPYCAYSERYACPIVPSDNVLKQAILAGVKAW